MSWVFRFLPPETEWFYLSGIKKDFCYLAKKRWTQLYHLIIWVNGQKKDVTTFRRRITMNRCEKCGFKVRYDKNPRSILGRIWKWHIGWCPGWKSYIRALPDEERKKLVNKYSSWWCTLLLGKGAQWKGLWASLPACIYNHQQPRSTFILWDSLCNVKSSVSAQ